MGTGRYSNKHTSALPQGVRDITDKFLERKYGKSSFMRDIHKAHPRDRGLNATLNANPGNYMGEDAKPELTDFIVGKYIDFNAWQDAMDKWNANFANKQDPYYADIQSFQVNCQRCVIAWEANYRGYDVEAKPNPSTLNDNFDKAYHSDNFLSTFRNQDGTVVKPLYDNSYYNVPGYYNMTKGKIGDSLRSDITSVMLKEGNGARFVIDFGRRSGFSGHTFTAEVVGNKIVVYEPQYARTSTLKHYINSETSRVRVTRVDNAYLDHKKFEQAVITHGKRRHSKHGGKYNSKK